MLRPLRLAAVVSALALLFASSVGLRAATTIVNTGVIAWRKSPEVARVFQAWGEEWLKWQRWDEQQALMRAVFKNPIRVLVLPEVWNHPHRTGAEMIFHNYGRGAARSDVKH